MPPNHTSVLIIGAGIAGLCTAIDLIRKTKCTDFIIVEKGGGIGGTWRDNQYPGCCCDVWSPLYSFSFEQNPFWSRLHPTQREILRYLMDVAQKYGLYRYIRFSTSVEKAQWNDGIKRWETQVSIASSKDADLTKGYIITSSYLVSAVGQLNIPKFPEQFEMGCFKGKTMHSARWDLSYSIQNKRVALIGSGATAAQIAPELAKSALQLTVYQRTPSWVAPRSDRGIPAALQYALKCFPPLRWRLRAHMMEFRESVLYNGLAKNDTASAEWLTSKCRTQLKQQLPNRPDLWTKLTPHYPIGCKRIVVSDDFYPVFRQPNVTLETGKIAKTSENGIILCSGEETEYDTIVLATGFRALDFMYPIKIKGVRGRTLADIWSGGTQALYGMTVEDLPNFAMLYGPNTNLPHSSIILMIEAQSRYINYMIAELLARQKKGEVFSIKPKKDKIEQYNDFIRSKLARSTFADPSCHSWYKNEDGLITTNWSGSAVEYQKMLSKLDWEDYEQDDGKEILMPQGRFQDLGWVREGIVIRYWMMAALVFGLWLLGTLYRSWPPIDYQLSHVRSIH